MFPSLVALPAGVPNEPEEGRSDDDGSVLREELVRLAAALPTLETSQDLRDADDEVAYVVTSEWKLLYGSVAHHPKFTCGQPVLCAGMIRTSSPSASTRTVRITNESGHYQPDEARLQAVFRKLRDDGLVPPFEELGGSVAFDVAAGS